MDDSKNYNKLGDTPHLHVGKLIAKVLNERRITQAEAAKRIGVSSPTFNTYLDRSSLQFGILWKISIALDYNLLGDLMDNLPESVFKNTKSTFRQQALDDLTAHKKELEAIKHELNIYKEILGRKTQS